MFYIVYLHRWNVFMHGSKISIFQKSLYIQTCVGWWKYDRYFFLSSKEISLQNPSNPGWSKWTNFCLPKFIFKFWKNSMKSYNTIWIISPRWRVEITLNAQDILYFAHSTWTDKIAFNNVIIHCFHDYFNNLFCRSKNIITYCSMHFLIIFPIHLERCKFYIESL